MVPKTPTNSFGGRGGGDKSTKTAKSSLLSKTSLAELLKQILISDSSSVYPCKVVLRGLFKCRMASVQVLETVSVFELSPCTAKMIISCVLGSRCIDWSCRKNFGAKYNCLKN